MRTHLAVGAIIFVGGYLLSSCGKCPEGNTDLSCSNNVYRTQSQFGNTSQYYCADGTNPFIDTAMSRYMCANGQPAILRSTTANVPQGYRCADGTTPTYNSTTRQYQCANGQVALTPSSPGYYRCADGSTPFYHSSQQRYMCTNGQAAY